MSNGKGHPPGCGCDFCARNRPRGEADITLVSGSMAGRMAIAEQYGRKVLDALESMLVNCDRAAEVVAKGRDMFDTDWATAYSGDMCLVRLGEAAGRLPDEFRKAYPGQRWKAWHGIRGRAAHSADPAENDPDIMWEALASSAPELRAYVVRDVFGETE